MTNSLSGEVRMPRITPIVAFGLLASTIALKAKTGNLRNSDKVNLQNSCHHWCVGLYDAREAVVDFLEAVDDYPIFAGKCLQSVARSLVPDAMILDDAEPIIEAAEAHAIASGWAGRADRRGGVS
jgi:hypothetical protein